MVSRTGLLEDSADHGTILSEAADGTLRQDTLPCRLDNSIS
jgi:hypothetical protein